VGELLRAIDYQGQSSVDFALKILPHVFVRPGELRNAQWDEFDFDGALWAIPGARMKMGREHNVPLSSQVLEPRLREVCPGSTKFERRCCELLRTAHMKARYSRQYRITAEELDWIGSRVEVLRGLIEELCLKRLDELERAA